MIEFRNVEIKYGDFTAISDLTLTINKGEFFTFLGPSGCGKTTTLRSLVGFITPTNGSILVDDHDITHVSIEKREIGMVFQSYALFPTMNVYENIAFGLKVQKISKEEIHERIMEVAQKIDLSEEQLYKNVSDLSGGQQQRVALARAIILKPKILCLDEPLSNLDAKLRVGLRRELKRLQRELGITTLYVTHDQEEALTLSDRIAVFNKGRIEQVGTPYEIYNQSASEFVCGFIGDINRLGGKIIQEINSQCGKHFDQNKVAFIRIERVYIERREGLVKLKGVVKDSEYNGIYSKNYFLVYGQNIVNVEKNDGITCHARKSEVDLYINPEDIIQF
jgi:iron(III) transport system ATP-binding protein